MGWFVPFFYYPGISLSWSTPVGLGIYISMSHQIASSPSEIRLNESAEGWGMLRASEMQCKHEGLWGRPSLGGGIIMSHDLRAPGNCANQWAEIKYDSVPDQYFFINTHTAAKFSTYTCCPCTNLWCIWEHCNILLDCSEHFHNPINWKPQWKSTNWARHYREYVRNIWFECN